MTDKTEAQPEALRLAAEFEDCTRIDAIPSINDVKKSAAELRRLHAEIQQLKAQLSARQAAPDGWRLVPESPTEEMLDAAHASDCEYSKRAFGGRMHMPQAAEDHWHVMLSAAPPPPEREPLTPDSSEVVTNEEMQRAFAGTNFGTTAYRHLLHQALLKKACEYHCGHTITQIMKELGLIGVTGRPLQKGIKMLRIAYREQMMEGP